VSPAIEVKEVFLLYRAPFGDVPALRGFNLELAEHESVAVLGPSGAGKSSLLTLCAGFRRPSSGHLRVLGTSIPTASAGELARLRQTSIGIVRQHYHRALPRELLVEEIVSLPLRLRGSWGAAGRERVTALLRAAGLEQRARSRPFELSGGEQQRVAVCAALAKRPRLLLADEPTGELDRRSSALVVELILGLSRDVGAAALIVTHDPEVAVRTARTIHVRDGRLSGEGSDNPTLVVDEQGWLRLPRRIREEAGVRERLRASATWGRIELLAVEPEAWREEHDSPLARPAPAEKRHRAEVALDSVWKSYDGESVIERFSWSFEPERLHVVAGPSGSGKTTLLNLAGGLERPDRGEVWVGGERIDGFGPEESARWRQRVLGYVSQHSTLVGFLSARENVELGLTLRGFAPAEATRRAAEWLAWVGVADVADRPGDRLSGGEQRRVALARALAPGPRLLLADEPTAHLDRLSGRRVIALLRRAVAEGGVTVITASHDPDLVAAADRDLDLGGVGYAEATG
jgi:ABC-type lipoprotein export system ATPase subunit